jgi:hypothetical protein
VGLALSFHSAVQFFGRLVTKLRFCPYTFPGSDTRKVARIIFYKHWLQKLEQIILPNTTAQLTLRSHIYGTETPLEKIGPSSTYMVWV